MVLGDRIIRDVLHILIAPVQRGIKDRSGNTIYDWVLFPLDGVETVKQLAVLQVYRTKIMKDIRDEGQ